MIGWLQGQVSDPWQQGARCGLLLLCQGVGYEVQLSQRHWRELPSAGSRLSLHIHHAIRDDAWTLYGFPQRQERDLFRELVAVSGVGPQMALGLLGAMAAEELARAIVQADLRQLSSAPGVGKRTAERLSVELRSRLQERFTDLLDGVVDGFDDWAESPTAGAEGAATALVASTRSEVEQTLEALGYEVLEIHRALRAVAASDAVAVAQGELGLCGDAETWLAACLRWLSRPAA
ncbi:Holliday junction branch migration protein RuvA [Synechococcus sp. CBW1006]|uniref:Holliday junction branch migration protein RuvA n=1 Tax=Synechococcus sp. CBW1006 TaxID=1353138 RepID=UPI0018CEA769|nr:Holliday junction branch migration protein RuvA [Synechococcus sp. CBW1006]QPN66030.1 Holliday junction branch migration protein RuvA [Synechococcus sp. CBW1006]